jgi:hypothetical protein
MLLVLLVSLYICYDIQLPITCPTPLSLVSPLWSPLQPKVEDIGFVAENKYSEDSLHE